MNATRIPQAAHADHLTDEQFSDALIGLDAGSKAAAHLAECGSCRHELKRFETTVGDLSFAARSWSEAQPSVSLRGRETSSSRTPVFALAYWTIAAAFVLGVGIPVAVHRMHPVGINEAADGDDSATQIAQDNQLMKDVSLVLGGDDASPYREYGIAPAQHGSAAHSHTRNR